jgi:hypothetical protein
MFARMLFYKFCFSAKKHLHQTKWLREVFRSSGIRRRALGDGVPRFEKKKQQQK